MTIDKIIKIQCANCGQELESWADYHTHESCLLFQLNDYRKQLGKSPIIVDIEREDTKAK